MSCFDNYDSQILKNLVLQGESNTTISKLLGLTVSQVRVRVKRDGLIGIRPAGGAHHKPKPKKPKPKKPKPEPKPMPPGHNGNRKNARHANGVEPVQLAAIMQHITTDHAVQYAPWRTARYTKKGNRQEIIYQFKENKDARIYMRNCR